MGSNSHGQLGIGGEATSKNTPTLIDSSHSMLESVVTKVACGNFHSLALTESGMAFAWGQGRFGALGNGRSGN